MPNAPSDAAKDLAGGFTVVAAVLTAVGTATGGVQRMFRNYTWWAVVALVLIVVGILAGFVARSPFEPRKSELGRWAGKVLSSTLLRVLAGVAAVAIFFGALIRIGWRAAVIVGAAALGAAVFATWFASMSGTRAQQWQKRILLTGTVAFALGFVLVVALAALSPTGSERPSIAATITEDNETGLALDATIKANGLRSDDFIVVNINWVTRGGEFGPTIYKSHTGPNSSGGVELPIKVPLASEGFTRLVIFARIGEQDVDCEPPKVGSNHRAAKKAAKQALKKGCLLLTLPASELRPTIDASFETTATGQRLLKTTTKTDVQSTSGAIEIEIHGLTLPGQPAVLIYSSLASPDSDGAINSTASLPIDTSFSNVCVRAISQDPSSEPTDIEPPTFTGDGGVICGVPNEAIGSWVSLRLPSS